MLQQSDLVRLPYTPDLTPAGIAYACKSLAYLDKAMDRSTVVNLRHIVSGKAVELAFRHYLSEQGIPYNDLGNTPFTDPDHYDISLGGRRCDLKSFQIFKRETIRRIRHEPAYLLQATALVPAAQVNSDHQQDSDLYIFAFSTGLVTHTQTDQKRALAAGQPICLIHTLPELWAHPPVWGSLGRLTLKAEGDQPLTLEIGGQLANREFELEVVILPPGQRVQVQREFYTMTYLKITSLPVGRVGVHSTRLDQTYIAPPGEWGNVWVYGMDVFIAGAMARGEFRQRSQNLPAGRRVLQYTRTRSPNQALTIADLYSVDDLLHSVRDWLTRTR